jgi:hypothetical protein
MMKRAIALNTAHKEVREYGVSTAHQEASAQTAILARLQRELATRGAATVLQEPTRRSDRAAAQTALQAPFLTMWQNLATAVGRESSRTWVGRACASTAA